MNGEVQQTNDILNDLLKINNHRIEEYEKEEQEADEQDLRFAFRKMADESRVHALELIYEIKKTETEYIASSATLCIRIYYIFMGMRDMFKGRGRNTVLDVCTLREDAIKVAYQHAVTSDGLTPEARQMLLNQQATMSNSYDIISSLRWNHQTNAYSTQS